MSDAIEAALTAYRETATYPIVPGNHSEAMTAALTAYEAAKGGGVDAREIELNVKAKLRVAFRKALADLPEIAPPEIRSVLSSVHMQDEFFQEGKRLQIVHGLDSVAPRVEQECGAGAWSFMRQGVLAALTSPASGAGTREEIKGAVGRETEGWPAETDHVPSTASGERDAPSGYVLVPLEPTEGMLAAGMDSLAESTGEPLSFIVRDVLFAYRAMVAALRMEGK